MPAKAAAKAIKSTKSTRQVQEEQVPAELRHLYDADRRKDDEEVSLDLTSQPAEDEEEVPMDKLFSVDGVDYLIPVEFGPSVGVIYIDRLSEGEDVALGAILKMVIGKEGWAALVKLAEDNRITGPQFKAILKKVNERTMGAVEAMGKA